jgi:hypothetical protein
MHPTFDLIGLAGAVTGQALVVRRALPVVRAVISISLVWDTLFWLGLALFIFSMNTQERSIPRIPSWAIGLGLVLLLLFAASAVGALRLLRVGRRAPRRLWLPVLILAVAQVVVLASGLSLSHFVRSGQMWTTTIWRRSLYELLLPEVFAYYPNLGLSAFVAAGSAVAVAIGRPLSVRVLE